MKTTVLTLALASFLSLGSSEAGDWTWKRPAKNLIPLAPPVVGSCLSYDYVDLEYFHTDFSSPKYFDGNSYGIAFSKSLGSSFFLTGGYADGQYDYNWDGHVVGVETRRYRLGAGVHHQLAQCIDLTFEGGAQHLDAEYPGYNDHDYDSWSYYFGPGIRAQAGQFEFFAKALYQKREGDFSQEYLSHHTSYYGRVDDYGWVFTPGFIFHFNERLGLKLAAEFGENETDYIAGIRYDF